MKEIYEQNEREVRGTSDLCKETVGCPHYYTNIVLYVLIVFLCSMLLICDF